MANWEMTLFLLRGRFLPNLALEAKLAIFFYFLFKNWPWRLKSGPGAKSGLFFFFSLGYLNLGFCHWLSMANTYFGGFLV
jgi:hypothetical protein